MSQNRRASYAGHAFPGPRVVHAGAIMSPTRRAARMLLATQADATLHRLLNRIQSSAQNGRILEWSHDANDLRVWQWPVHQRQPHAGSFVAPSGLRLYLSENRIPYPVCLCGRNNAFATRGEVQTTIVTQREGGTTSYQLLCAKHGTENDCFYEVTLPRTPAADWRNIVFSPTFQFDDIGRSSLGYYRDDDLRGVLAPRGLSMLEIEMPFMPPSAYNSAGLVETRALMALNSPFGLKVDYLATLQRLLQYCNYCDVVGLPAAMRDHIDSGNCRRFARDLEHDNDGDNRRGSEGAGPSGSSGGSSSSGSGASHKQSGNSMPVASTSV